MSNFKDTKNKIRRIWDEDNLNQDEIKSQQSENTKINDRTDKFNKLQTQLKSVIDNTDDWVQITYIPFQGIADRYAVVTWNFTISGITEELINAFKFDFIFKTGTGEVYTDLTPSNLTITKRVTYQRLQSLSDPNVFDLKVDASIFFQSVTSVQSDLYAKLNIIEVTPYLFTTG